MLRHLPWLRYDSQIKDLTKMVRFQNSGLQGWERSLRWSLAPFKTPQRLFDALSHTDRSIRVASERTQMRESTGRVVEGIGVAPKDHLDSFKAFVRGLKRKNELLTQLPVPLETASSALR